MIILPKGQNYLYIKGDLSVKSNSYLITLKDADPSGSAFEMLKGVKKKIQNYIKHLLQGLLYRDLWK